MRIFQTRMLWVQEGQHVVRSDRNREETDDDGQGTEDQTNQNRLRFRSTVMVSAGLFDFFIKFI